MRPVPTAEDAVMLMGGEMPSATVEQTITITPCSPFTGRAIAEPRTEMVHVPADIDTEECPVADAPAVIAWVGNDPERARAATLTELARATPRRRLLKALEAIQ